MTPTVVGDLVYGASCSGVLFALDKSSGEVRWRYDTAQDGRSASFHGDPVVTDELLVISSDVSSSGFVYAFELDTGEVCYAMHENMIMGTYLPDGFDSPGAVAP